MIRELDGDAAMDRADEEIARLEARIQELEGEVEHLKNPIERIVSQQEEFAACEAMPWDEYWKERDGNWFSTRAIMAERKVEQLRADLAQADHQVAVAEEIRAEEKRVLIAEIEAHTKTKADLAAAKARILDLEQLVEGLTGVCPSSERGG